jgi:tRNA uridine 5-carboxymethylaminomethyl modification enzyme
MSISEKTNYYDVIVVGAGHAGCEAALSCSRLGLKTLILTINLDKIALMPCNPAIGGTGKSHLVLELDALGGEMAKAADKAAIQIRILNKSKGPAVRALRAQIDKKEYEMEMKNVLEQTENLTLRQGNTSSIILKRNKIAGIITDSGIPFYSKAVIISTGTFLKGRIVIGKKDYDAGRMGEYPSMHLSDSLKKLGLKIDRFQTATPPRVDKRTIDFNKMQLEAGEECLTKFSFWGKEKIFPNIPSFLTYTNEYTHKIIKDNIEHSPIKSGMVRTHGPRHCPSIDRKVINYESKKRHPVFVEPEGTYSNESYLQGLTTSMPAKIQQQIVNTVPGLENARIVRPGYAVEYDFILPDQLKHTLESKKYENLYFAGQIIGTSGYEEAAVLGFVAGVNAARKILNKKPMILNRSDSYIGVLIDDLITKQLIEPYRMYTSRSEYRLLLRPDNADIRLAKTGYEIGLINSEQFNSVVEKNKKINNTIKYFSNYSLNPSEELNHFLSANNTAEIESTTSLFKLIKRPEIKASDLICFIKNINKNSSDRIAELPESTVVDQVEINIKYGGYIERALKQVKKFAGIDNIFIDDFIDYHKIGSLTFEAREKLSAIRPETLGQASRIAGVSPADISVLLIYLKSKKNGN